MVVVLWSFAANAECDLDIVRHDGDAFCVDGGEVGVFKEANEVGFGGFLEASESTGGQTKGHKQKSKRANKRG